MVLINANSELPLGHVNAVLSRLPLGIVNLLQGQPPPAGPSLRSAYQVFNVGSALAVMLSLAMAWWASRPLRRWAPLVLTIGAACLVSGVYATGMTPTLLAASVPDLAVVLAIMSMVLCLPLILRIGGWARHASSRAAPS